MRETELTVGDFEKISKSKDFRRIEPIILMRKGNVLARVLEYRRTHMEKRGYKVID